MTEIVQLEISKIRTDHCPFELDPQVVDEWTRYYTDGTPPSPYAIFADCTYFHDDTDHVILLKRYCWALGYIPGFDFDPQLGWIFHTLYTPEGGYWKKEIAKRFTFEKRTPPNERDLERDIANFLRGQGIHVRRQVRCSAGIADIVTPDAVYEVELRLTRDKFFEAVGQVLLYRQAINPSFRAIIAGKPAEESASLITFAAQIGVEVLLWTK